MYVCLQGLVLGCICRVSQGAELTEENITLFRPLLLERRFDQWFHGGHLVKELNMKCGANTVPQLEPDLYTVLLSYFPNLKVIDFGSSHQYQGSYGRLLLSAADSQQCLQRIQNIYIRDIASLYYLSNADDEVYFSTCYKLRRSITHLTINFPTSSITFTFNRISADYIHFLPHFTQLTNLAICNASSYNIRTGEDSDKIEACILPLVKVLNACPSLVYFKYECNYSIPADETLNTILPTAFTHYSNNASQLKKLVLTIPALATPFMQYLTRQNAIKELRELVLITLSAIDFKDWIHNEDRTTTLMAFAKDLQSVRHLTIKHKCRNPVSAGSSTLFVDPSLQDGVFSHVSARRSSLEEIQLYWNFVNTVKGPRELGCDARFAISQVQLRELTGFELCVKNNCIMDLSYRFSNAYSLFFSDEALVPQLSSFFESGAATGDSSRSIVDMLRDLHLDIFINKADFPAPSQVKILQDVLLIGGSFHIDKFYIQVANSHHGSSSSTRPSSHLVESTGTTFTHMGVTENLTRFTITCLPIVPEILHLLAQYVPNLTSLTLKSSKFEFDEQYNTLLDLRDNVNLQNLELHMKNLGLHTGRQVFIRIKWSNDDFGYVCYRSERVHGVMNIHRRYVYAWAPTDEMFISPYNSKLSSGNTCMITMKYGGSLDSFILQDCVTGSTYNFTAGSRQQIIQTTTGLLLGSRN